MKDDRLIETSVQRCVELCGDSPYVIGCVFDFVHRLIHEDGWTEEDARQVGAQALQRLRR